MILQANIINIAKGRKKNTKQNNARAFFIVTVSVFIVQKKCWYDIVYDYNNSGISLYT